MADFTSGTLTATATTPSGTANSASQLVLPTVGCGGAAFTVSNAAGTVGFWATGDGGAHWTAMAVSPASGGALIITTSAAGLWQVNCSGYTHVSLLATAITAGSINASIHISPVAAFESGGGGGPGGMVPTGSTGIGAFTTTGSSGAATYNPTTGALNIPNSVPNGLTPNLVQLVTTSYSTSSTTAVSSGEGVAFTPQSTQTMVTLGSGVNGTAGYVYIYRTTAGIPTAGSAIPGPDVLLSSLGNATILNYQLLNATVYDTGLTPGTPYNYYLGIKINASGTITLQAGGKMQICEFHL